MITGDILKDFRRTKLDQGDKATFKIFDLEEGWAKVIAAGVRDHGSSRVRPFKAYIALTTGEVFDVLLPHGVYEAVRSAFNAATTT